MSSANPLPVTGGGGSGGGDATAANQATQVAIEQAIRDEIGALSSPAAGSVNNRLGLINTTLGAPFQAGGIIGNTAFGISGTLPTGYLTIGRVKLTDGTTVVPVEGTMADGNGNGSALITAARLQGFNGANWTRIRTDGTGRLSVRLQDGNSTDLTGNQAFTGTNATTQTGIAVGAYQRYYSAAASGWVPLQGDAVGPVITSAPTATVTNSITPVVGSLVSSIVGKAAAGNLYGVSITTGAAAAYLYVFNSTTAPADGSVTAGTASGQYQLCSAVAATTTFTSTFEFPERYSVGISPVVSSTACGTLTKITSAVFLKARVQ